MGEPRMGRLLLKSMNVQYKIHLERARGSQRLTRAGGGVRGRGHE